MPPYGPDFMRFHQGGPGLVGGLFFLLFLVIVVVAATWLLASVVRPRGHFAHHDHLAHAGTGTAPVQQSDALRILDERFARGEIDVDDYRARRDLLTRPAP